MLIFCCNCWGPLDNPVKTPYPVVVPLLCLVCPGMLNKECRTEGRNMQQICSKQHKYAKVHVHLAGKLNI